MGVVGRIGAGEEGAEEFHAVGEQGKRAAAVGEDPLDRGIAAEDAGEDQVADGTCGVEDELQHGPGPFQVHGLGARG